MHKHHVPAALSLKLIFLLFVVLSMSACGPNEEVAHKNIQEAKRAMSEGKRDDAIGFLKLVPENTKIWSKERKEVAERLQWWDATNIKEAKEALSVGRLDDARMYLNLVDVNSAVWSAERKAIAEAIESWDATNIREAKKSLSAGNLDDAEKYLNLVDVNSTVWKNEGLALMGQLWKKRKNSPDRIKKEKEAANYAEKLNPSWHGVKFKWERGGFGTVAILTFITIENTSSDTCKDMSGIMSFFAASGTKLGSLPFTIYDIISPHSKRTFRNINVGIMPPPIDQVKSANIDILNCR